MCATSGPCPWKDWACPDFPLPIPEERVGCSNHMAQRQMAQPSPGLPLHCGMDVIYVGGFLHLLPGF